MRCANPNCNVMADDLLTGTLTLVEFETAPDDRILHAGGGFPICVARTRYFWLCATCSRLFRILKWNSAGPILESQHGQESWTPEPYVRRKAARTANVSERDRSRRSYGAA
jgi:hypothetical protein